MTSSALARAAEQAGIREMIESRVIVLRDGTVAEEGSHDELVARGGEYARLFEAQAQ